jgi:hypothetical protein
MDVLDLSWSPELCVSPRSHGRADGGAGRRRCGMTRYQLTASAWGGLDTLHILAGVPSTSTLMEAAGVTLKPADPAGPAGPTGSSSTTTTSASAKFKFERTDGTSKSSSPDKAGMDRIAVEARACAEINYVGTVLALACFVSTGEACPARLSD